MSSTPCVEEPENYHKNIGFGQRGVILRLGEVRSFIRKPYIHSWLGEKVLGWLFAIRDVGPHMKGCSEMSYARYKDNDTLWLNLLKQFVGCPLCRSKGRQHSFLLFTSVILVLSMQAKRPSSQPLRTIQRNSIE